MPDPRPDGTRAPVFTPKLSGPEIRVLVQVADAALRALDAPGDPGGEAGDGEGYEALVAARAKLVAALDGFDLANGHHFSPEQLTELGQLGA